MTIKTFPLTRAGLALSMLVAPAAGCLDDSAPDLGEARGEVLVPSGKFPGPLDPPLPPSQEGRCFGRVGDDHFGSEVTAGDFDGDGDTDLAVAARRDDDFAAAHVGAVFVYRRVGTTYVPWQRLSPTALGLGPSSGVNELGRAMVAADFDGDGKAELAIYNHNDHVGEGSGPWSGTVVVIGGSPDDTFAVQQVLSQAGLGTDETGDEFGSHLAVGDFDADGAPDLAVAAPGDDEGGSQWKGRAYVFRGGGAQLAPWRVLSPSAFLLQDAGFGQALAAGDFDGNGYDDLAIGLPEHDMSSSLAQGTVLIYRSTAGNPVQASRLLEGRLYVSPSNGNRAYFGRALAAADMDGDGDDELAVGAPGASWGSNLYAGAVKIFRNASVAPSLWSTIQMPFPQANQGKALAAGDFDGNGAVDLAVSQDPYGAMGSLLIWKGRINNTPNFGDDYAPLFDEVAAADLDGDGRADLLVSPDGDNHPLAYGYGRSSGMPVLDHTLYQQAPHCVPHWGSPPVITLREARRRELDLRITSSGNVEEVRWRRDDGATWIDEGAIVDRTDTGLAPGTEYCYQGRTLLVGSDTFSDYSPETCFETAPPLPRPTITLLDRTTTTLSVRIVAGSGADRIRSRLENVANTTRTDDLTTVNRAFTGLSPDTQYCVIADSFHPDDDEWSQERTACFSTEPLIETGTSAVTLNAQSVPQGNVPFVGWWGPIADASPVRVRLVAQVGDRWLHFVKAGFSTADCWGPYHSDRTVTLQDGGMLGAAEIAEIQGGTPPPGAQLLWVACHQSYPVTYPTWVTINIDWERPND